MNENRGDDEDQAPDSAGNKEPTTSAVPRALKLRFTQNLKKKKNQNERKKIIVRGGDVHVRRAVQLGRTVAGSN